MIQSAQSIARSQRPESVIVFRKNRRSSCFDRLDTDILADIEVGTPSKALKPGQLPPVWKKLLKKSDSQPKGLAFCHR